jgi:hypothetical protein
VRLFQNKVLREIFGSVREEVLEHSEKLHNEKLHNFSSKVRLGDKMGGEFCKYGKGEKFIKNDLGNVKGREHWENTDEDEGLLKWILKEQGLRIWCVFI